MKKKLTLSVRGDIVDRVGARHRAPGSLSALVEDFLETLDGESLADSLCSELGINCEEPLLAPGEVISRRPRSAGARTRQSS
ncbi:MAG: hypothetical protein LM577_02885 [Thermoproteaceae archaeon]|nr:hypothetical protein [Thermoproteaceae archaeon]